MQLHFREYGQGQPLIVLHGLFGSLDNWHPLSQKFAEQFRVLALDLRNHGQSPHSDEMNYSLMASDVNEFMESQSLASAMVLGHSMGGKTAMQFALSYPAKTEALIVADMAPRAYPPAHEEIFRALLALDLKSFQTRQEIETALEWEIPQLSLRRFLLKNLTRDDAGAFRWKINLAGAHRNYPRLNEPLAGQAPFDGPALFVRGGKSRYVREVDEPEIRRLFPEVQFVTIPEAGHWIHADAPESFCEAVLNFLSAHKA